MLDRPGEAIHGPFADLMGRGGPATSLLTEQDAVVVRFGEEPQRLRSTP